MNKNINILWDKFFPNDKNKDNKEIELTLLCLGFMVFGTNYICIID